MQWNDGRSPLKQRGYVGVLVFASCVASAAAQPLPAGEPAPSTTKGQQRSGAPLRLSWPQLRELVDQHPELAAGRWRQEAARQAIDGAGAIPNPMLEGTLGRGVAREGNAERTEWGLALTIPLGWLAQRGAQVAEARAEAEVVTAEGAQLRRQILRELQTLFWSIAYEQARVALLEALARESEALVKTVEARVKSGESRPIEASLVEIELEKVSSELDGARSVLASRRGELALWLRLPVGTELLVLADLDALPSAVSREVALDKARARDPQVQVAQAQTRALAATVTREKRGRIPEVELTGFTNSELDRRAYGVGLSIDLPLWNWNGGRIAEAEAKLAAGQKEAEASSLALEASVVDAEASCLSALARAERFRSAILPRSEAAAHMVERTYQLGEANLLEVLNARRTFLEARQLHLNTLVQAQTDCSRLQALVGEDAR